MNFPAAPYRAPRWLRGGHAQTIYPALFLRARAKPVLAGVRLPTLVLNAKNDPFLPLRHLPRPQEVPAAVLLEQPEEGGHVGFASGSFPGNLDWLPQRLLAFFAGQARPVR